MRDAATQDRRRNGHAKLWIFREIAKWRRWRHAPRLTATAVITDSRYRSSKRWHVSDVKPIACDDQTNLMVHRNSANIVCIFRFYVCLRLCDCDCCSPNGRSKFRNLGLFTFTRSTNTPAAAPRLMAASGDRSNVTLPTSKISPGWPGSIEIPQIKKCMPTRSSKTSRKTSFCCYERRRDWRHCALFTFLLSLAMAFVFTFEK